MYLHLTYLLILRCIKSNNKNKIFFNIIKCIRSLHFRNMYVSCYIYIFVIAVRNSYQLKA